MITYLELSSDTGNVVGEISNILNIATKLGCEGCAVVVGLIEIDRQSSTAL